MVKDLVSIVTPCYNGESYIERFLNSVLMQTYRNMELILINDGSRDNTEKIIFLYEEKLRKKNIDLKYIYQENSGQAEAVNKGLKLAKGEFIIWPDSDDILYENNISEKVAYLKKNTECGAVVSVGRIVKENDLSTGIRALKVKHTKDKENLFERLIFEEAVYFAPAGYMVRSEAFDSVVVERCIYASACGQNWQMLLPVAYKYEFGFVDKILFDYVLRDNSHSRKEKNYLENKNKTYIHEDCLINTIDRICMSDEKRKNLYYRIKLKYVRRRLKLAFEFNNLSDLNESYSLLKDENMVERSDEIIYKRGMSKIYDMYYRCLNAVSAFIVRSARLCKK